MSSHSTDKFATVPDSLIVGEFGSGVSTENKASVMLLCTFLDLQQGEPKPPLRARRGIEMARYLSSIRGSQLEREGDYLV